MYALYFGLPVFLRQRFTRAAYIASPVISEVAITAALLLVLVGLAGFYVGYYLMRGGERAQLYASTRGVWSIAMTVLLGAAGTSAYVVQLRITLVSELQQVVELVSSLMILAACLGYVAAMDAGRRRPFALLALVMLIGARFVLGLGTGSPAQFYQILIPLLMLAAVRRRRIPVELAVVGLLIFLPVQAAKFQFREAWWVGDRTAPASPWSAGAAYIGLAIDATSSMDLDIAIDGLSSRLGYLTTLADVLELTPSQIPYWGGQTLLPLATKLVPRFLWPSKPVEVTGQTFGHRYGFLQPWDTATSYNMPHIIELYVNWGVIGVVIGMVILGGVYGIIHRVSVPPAYGWERLATAAYTMGGLVLIESGISQTISGVLYRAAFVFFLGTMLVGPSSLALRRRQPRSVSLGSTP
ncbi:MAG: hypothetical protein QN168_14470 [Armatimonadota bacterium]|nr:hypothetical protein [Armatimonadota bacterium]